MSYLDALRKSTKKEWAALSKAERKSVDCRERIQRGICSSLSSKPYSSDVDLVVFGSLARDEMTEGSDVDWTLLIDGQVDPHHRTLANNIAECLRAENLIEPGSSGVFGSLAFSHDIVHHIGGQSDSNRNTTRRILLLLESKPLEIGSSSSGVALERVIRGVLDRYVRDDNLLRHARSAPSVPRFLLNDIVRFWRTMCVDYAGKEWEQDGKKIAIRNIKLRMSRKLIFVSGLLTCFSCLNIGKLPENEPDARNRALVEHLYGYVKRTPMDIFCEALQEHSNPQAAITALDAYDAYVAILQNDDTRQELAEISCGSIEESAVFKHAYEITRTFQKSLDTLFFANVESELNKFITRYGVF